MTNQTLTMLRQQLPSYFWLRDQEDGGGILDAWIRALAGQYEALSDAIDELYDGLFIETCPEEHVPLIGAGIGVGGLSGISAPGVSERAWVGQIIGLRRRKGMLATVARGATAATGWPAHVREGRPLTAASFAVDDPPAGAPELAQISTTAARGPATPVEQLRRSAAFGGQTLMAGEDATADPARPAGFPAPAMVELAVARLRSFPVTGRTAAPASDAPAELAGRAFRFDPLGRDLPLFTTGAAPRAAGVREDADALPRPLTMAQLDHALARGGEAPVAVGDLALHAADLGGWAVATVPAGHVAVDPLRGRLVLPSRADRPPVVSYAYGAAGEVGAGPYASSAVYAALPDDARALTVDDGDGLPADTGLAQHTAIVFAGSATHATSGWELHVPADGDLRIACEPLAAPVIDGDVTIHVPAGARLELSGLTIAGALTVDGDGELRVEQCTLLAPAEHPGLRLAGDIAALVEYSLISAVEAGDRTTLAVNASIVDGPARASSLSLDGVTALGAVTAEMLLASDCILMGSVDASAGLAQTSYVAGGTVPMRACVTGRDEAPRFTSTNNAHPAFCQLDLRCPAAVATCAAHGGEPGAFGFLRQHERFARLSFVVANFLPAGVGASVRFIT